MKLLAPTLAMNEWGFISQESLAVLGKSATICKFINCCGCVQMESLVVSKPTHHSLSVTKTISPLRSLHTFQPKI